MITWIVDSYDEISNYWIQKTKCENGNFGEFDIVSQLQLQVFITNILFYIRVLYVEADDFYLTDKNLAEVMVNDIQDPIMIPILKEIGWMKEDPQDKEFAIKVFSNKQFGNNMLQISYC